MMFLLIPIVLATEGTVLLERDLCFLVPGEVCGADGLTYENACHAEFAMIQWNVGACQEEESKTDIATFIKDNIIIIGIVFIGLAIYQKKKS